MTTFHSETEAFRNVNKQMACFVQAFCLLVLSVHRKSQASLTFVDISLEVPISDSSSHGWCGTTTYVIRGEI
jgi:hypothetical protein